MANNGSTSQGNPVIDVQGDNRWNDMHEQHVKDCCTKKPEILFVGDSIVQRFGDTQAWHSIMDPLKVVNAGIGGDTTKNVLWRLNNGLLDYCSPKAVVIWVGTNNHGDTSDEIVYDIEAITWRVTSETCKAIVLAVLPRGKKHNILRDKIDEVNNAAERVIETIPNASFLSVDPGFVQEDGCISRDDMMDYLHPSQKGYSKIAPFLHFFLKKSIFN